MKSLGRRDNSGERQHPLLIVRNRVRVWEDVSGCGITGRRQLPKLVCCRINQRVKYQSGGRGKRGWGGSEPPRRLGGKIIFNATFILYDIHKEHLETCNTVGGPERINLAY